MSEKRDRLGGRERPGKECYRPSSCDLISNKIEKRKIYLTFTSDLKKYRKVENQ